MNASPLVIALGHRKRVGKDTVAGILVEEYAFQRVSFAQPLKEIMHDMFPHLDHEQLFGDEKEECDAKLSGRTPREVMVQLATSIRERLGSAALIAPAMSKLVPNTTSTRPHRPRVVTDMRFLNEYRALQSIKNCVFVRVVRPGVKSVQSEDELDDDSLWNYTIVNDGSIEQLGATVRKLLTRMALGANATARPKTGQKRVIRASSFAAGDA